MILLYVGLLHTPYIVLTLHPERYIKKRACGLVSRFRRRGRNLNPRLLSLMESFEEPFNSKLSTRRNPLQEPRAPEPSILT